MTHINYDDLRSWLHQLAEKSSDMRFLDAADAITILLRERDLALAELQAELERKRPEKEWRFLC